MNPAHHKNVAAHFGVREDKEFKATLFESERLLLGVNCLEPGQAQRLHRHEAQDKFYAVQEGVGWFTVGSDAFEAAAGDVVWARAGVPHGVENRGGTRLAMLVGIAPAPGGR